MARVLFNVRLDPADALRVSSLRADGVQLSQIVRAAIREAYDKRANGQTRSKRNPQKILQAVYDRFPIPDHVPPPGIDLADRQAVNRAILHHLKRKRKPR